MISLIISGKSSTDVTVQVQANNRTATGESRISIDNYYACNTGSADFVTGPYTAIFTAGRTEASFSVPIIGDIVLERNEQFQLSIIPASLPDRVSVGNPSQATVTIRNDDGESHTQYCDFIKRSWRLGASCP